MEDSYQHFLTISKIMQSTPVRNSTLSFCKIVNTLEWAISNYQITFNCGERNRIPAMILKKRNFEFLATISLNLGSWPNAMRGMTDLWSQIRQVRCAGVLLVQLN